MPDVTHLELDDITEWPTAIADTAGPQLILAGPGTGKTDFLAQRAAYLLEQGVAADELLVLTFSRRAATELEERIQARLSRPTSGASASTFHAFAHRLVETHRHGQGREMPTLLTGPEQVRLVSEMLAEEDPEPWPASFRRLLTSDTLAGEVADFLMRCHERLLSPDSLAWLARRRTDWKALPEFLKRYLEEIDQAGKIDYGLLVSEAVGIAETTTLADQYRFILVDEYQDTSPAQARLAESIAGEPADITVAADPNQSIYSFRGADLANVEEFPTRMAGRDKPVRIVSLRRSFRVPADILAAARRTVISDRPSLLPRPEVIPAAHGGRVEAYTFDQRSAEAEWIAAEVERMAVSEGMRLDSMAVVVRSTRHLLPELSRALDRRHIPHDRPDRRLVDHPAIRMVADAAAAACSPTGTDRDLAIRRLLLGPSLALSLGQERELYRTAVRRRLTWEEILESEVPAAIGLTELIRSPEWARDQPAIDGFWHLWDHLPGLERLVTDPARKDFRSAWSTLARVLERQAERDPRVSLIDWLETAQSGGFEANPLLSFTRPESDRLVVTTLHQAKGLEFDVVFVADAVEGVFPDTRRSRRLLQTQLLDPDLTTDASAQARFRLDEERRLAYTATTRARLRVVWTATTAGIDEGDRRPSRFMLPIVDAASFAQIGPPESTDDDGFHPLTLVDAETRLRRLVMDPVSPPAERLAALSVLTSPDSPWDPRQFAGVPEPGPDTGVIRGEIHLSPSQAGLYDGCPRRYALERRLRAVEVDSPYLTFGSLVHEVLELAERAAVDAGAPHADLATALKHLDEVWGRYPPFGPPPIDEAWRRRAMTLLEEMYGDWPGEESAPVALELALDTTIEATQWVGRADRVEHSPGGLKVVDYKTSKNPPPLKEVARSLQLGYYLLAAADNPDLAAHGPPVSAELWFPLAKRKRKVYPFDMSNLGEVRERLVQVANGIIAEDWTPRVSGDCDRCPVRIVCPAWPDGREAYR